MEKEADTVALLVATIFFCVVLGDLIDALIRVFAHGSWFNKIFAPLEGLIACVAGLFLLAHLYVSAKRREEYKDLYEREQKKYRDLQDHVTYLTQKN